MTTKRPKHSKFPPIFIASTAIFFLSSAYKFIFGKTQETATLEPQSQDHLPPQPMPHVDTSLEKEEESEEDTEQEDHPQEPEDDPIQSL